ncbi:MAG: hypothetical protein HQ445_05490 [Polaromonas sp.]|nr:hypothetical protein [Polaromonas sp.]
MRQLELIDTPQAIKCKVTYKNVWDRRRYCLIENVSEERARETLALHLLPDGWTYESQLRIEPIEVVTA